MDTNILYKNNIKLSQRQNQRREEILLNSRSKRDKLISGIRNLVADMLSDEQIMDANYDVGENESSSSSSSLSPMQTMPMSSTTATSNKEKQTNCRKFRNKAMLSEHLIQKPLNFENEWFLKATPIGKRCLVFSKKGQTVAYSRTGKFIKSFQSLLPGGSRNQLNQCKRQFAIIDCIFVEAINSFFLMDCLAWNEHKLYESEASFRSFWLQSRYNENKEKLQTLSSKNESRFFCLQTYSASNKEIYEALHNDPLIRNYNLQLDGLLFFHSAGPYVPGANPLVLWIKPDKVNQVFDMNSAIM